MRLTFIWQRLINQPLSYRPLASYRDKPSPSHKSHIRIWIIPGNLGLQNLVSQTRCNKMEKIKFKVNLQQSGLRWLPSVRPCLDLISFWCHLQWHTFPLTWWLKRRNIAVRRVTLQTAIRPEIDCVFIMNWLLIMN